MCDLSRGAPHIEIIVSQGVVRVDWSIELESGSQLSGVAEVDSLPLKDRNSSGSEPLEKRVLSLPADLPAGYHRFSLKGASATCSLIVSPGRCWKLPDAAAGRRHWGLSAQLYTVRSTRNWGIGDFSDLRELVLLTEAAGGDIVGINPLHALFPTNPAHASPYSPSSRLLLNVLYIDVTEVPEFLSSPDAQRLVHSVAFRERLYRCRASNLVDYPTVAHFKLTVLHDIYRHFVEQASTARREAFAAFRRRQTPSFELACVFQALLERLSADDPTLRDVTRWPAELAHSQAPGVEAFRNGARGSDHRVDVVSVDRGRATGGARPRPVLP